ncbi:MAG: putative ATPase/class 3 adenylate cyclase [Gammaproteobacteria bacterium]|jgi:predicted ATPase/class 3 adenylate cyclase
MQSISDWLVENGFESFIDTFLENELTVEVLSELTEEDLKELGLSMGPRKLFLKRLREQAITSSPNESIVAKVDPVEEIGNTTERRQLTVMFCDLVGSTALSESLDPEEFRAVLIEYQGLVVKVVRGYDGYVAKYMGDGLMIYFGYPVSHEDAAERAVRTGIDIIASVQNHSATRSIQFQVRIGVSTGLVVAGDIDIDGSSESRAVLGDTPNLAARLQSFADPDCLLVCSATQQITAGRFESTSIGSHKLKGISVAQEIFKVTNVTGSVSRFDSRHGSQIGEIVGREHEIGLLSERWRQATESEPHVVLLSGEAGIGKSRIVRALQQRAEQSPHTLLSFQCVSFQTNSALQPFIAQLEIAVGIDRLADAQTNLSRLEQFLANINLTKPEEISLYAGLLSIDSSDRYPLLEWSAEKRKQALLLLVARTLLGYCKNGPVLMVFEDAHWADATSLELLEALITHAERQAFLLVITHRPEFTVPWSNYTHLSTLPLSRISRSAIRKIIDNVTSAKRLPEEVEEEIVRKTDGVPLFIEELTKMIIESDMLLEHVDHYTLLRPLRDLAIPSTLQASLLARLDRLAPAREVAQTAAAIGREFDLTLLSMAVMLSAEKLSDALTVLLDAGLIYKRGLGEQQKFIFKHALIQDAAYESLLKTKRQQIHSRLVDILNVDFKAESELKPDVIAYHATRAGNIQQAIPLWLKAAGNSRQSSSYVEARTHLDFGLELIHDYPDLVDSTAWKLRYQAMLGQVWWAVRGYASPEAREAYQLARTLCKEVNLPELTAPVLLGVWMFLTVGGKHRQAITVSNELVEAVSSSTERNANCAALYSVALSQFAIGENPAGAREGVIKCIATGSSDPEDRSMMAEYGGDLRATAMAYMTWIEFSLGKVDSAEDYAKRVQGFTEKLNNRLVSARIDWILSMYYAMANDWANAETIAKRSLDTANELNSTMTQGAASAIYYSALAMQHDDSSMLNKIQDGLNIYEASGAQFFTIQKLTHYAQALIKHGQIDKALEILRRAKGRIAEQGERYFEAEVHRLFAAAYDADELTDSTMAQASLRRALEISNSQKTCQFGLRAAIQLAKLLQSEDKISQARECLSDHLEKYQWQESTTEFQQAKSLLVDLQSDRVHSKHTY